MGSILGSKMDPPHCHLGQIWGVELKIGSILRGPKWAPFGVDFGGPDLGSKMGSILGVKIGVDFGVLNRSVDGWHFVKIAKFGDFVPPNVK